MPVSFSGVRHNNEVLAPTTKTWVTGALSEEKFVDIPVQPGGELLCVSVKNSTSVTIRVKMYNRANDSSDLFTLSSFDVTTGVSGSQLVQGFPVGPYGGKVGLDPQDDATNGQTAVISVYRARA